MTTNVIKQVVKAGEYGSQTIKMIVRSNERGPKGEKGDPGIQGPQGIQGPRGYDGVIQYRAGTGIDISDDNIISATGDATAAWGGIQGNIDDQTDLKNALNAKQDVMADFTGANGIVGGTSGKVPAPAATDNVKFLKGDGTWSDTPAPGNGTLTIQNNGSTLDTFTANATSNKTINIISPVKIGSTLSNNTVQLVNVGGSNIFPISNSLSNNTVTTASINNSAVTGSKIDFTTLLNNPNFVKRGTFSAVYQADNSVGGFQDVTFDTPFPVGVTPFVFVSNPCGTGRIASIGVTSTTNAKFTILARMAGESPSDTYTFNYIALNFDALCLASA